MDDGRRGGLDRLAVAVTAAGRSAARRFGFDLALDRAATRPVALHDGDGYVDFGPAGGSYYYSRTRMAATGMLTVDG